jgi:cysteinyl-tRNA synthetase
LLTLFNSMGRRLEVFSPLSDREVKMYTCGPSIYLLPHIGNYRTFLYEDILQRYLEYLGYEIKRVLNVTDVEDKAIAQADKEGMTLRELTDRNFTFFLQELKKLRIKIPDFIPRSSTSVEPSVDLMERLLKNGYAYWHGGNVYYDPLKFVGFGKLYGLDMGKWPKKKRRFHKDTYPGNRWNRGDFILWKGYKEGDKVYWDTRLGRGRPAWNIQDPAMAMKYLGSRVDISCGGVDNMIRHHDYVIAVAEGATGEEFAHYWLHGAHLYVNGKKMSKSVGNIIYPKDLVDRGYDWEQVRFFLIYGYYRKTLNFTYEKLEKTREKLLQLQGLVRRLGSAKSTPGKSDSRVKRIIDRLKVSFEEEMNGDLHVKAAIDSLQEILSRLVDLKEKGKVSSKDVEQTMACLREIDGVLHVLF